MPITLLFHPSLSRGCLRKPIEHSSDSWEKVQSKTESAAKIVQLNVCPGTQLRHTLARLHLTTAVEVVLFSCSPSVSFTADEPFPTPQVLKAAPSSWVLLCCFHLGEIARNFPEEKEGPVPCIFLFCYKPVFARSDKGRHYLETDPTIS